MKGYDQCINSHDKYTTSYDKYINNYDKYIKGYYKYIKGYDKYIHIYDKYTKDFLEKIFTAMTNIFTAIPKNIYGYCAHCINGQWSQLDKMAAEVDDLEAFFLHSIPSLFRQAEQNLPSDNLIVLEYFEHRLDDHTYVIRSFIL